MYEQLLGDLNPWWADSRVRVAQERTRRTQQAEVVRNLTRTDRRATVLVGPRQVGKTVILKQCVDDLLNGGWPAGNITYFDFSDDRLTGQLQSPREIVDLTPSSFAPDHRRVILLDEISRVAGWADWLKQMVDRQSHRIVVTDSAAHLLHGAGRESGLGRWDEIHLEGLTYREFLEFQALPGEAADAVERRLPSRLETFLFAGGFPEHVQNQSLDEVRRRIRTDIADKALRRDLLGVGVDVERVRELFVYLMEDSGAIFDGDARSRALIRMGDDQPDRRSMEKWLGLLLDTHLVCRVDPFATNPTGRLGGRSKPKLYAVDQGLISAFASSPQPFADSKLRGQVTEAAVLRAIRSLGPDKITYARDLTEIDFVVDWASARVVVEVTSGDDPRRKSNAARAHLKKLHAARAVVVHSGLEQSDDATIAPLHRFLQDPKSFLRVP